LNGNVNEAFGIDIQPTVDVFAAGSSLGQFYRESGVPQRKYNPSGSDVVFREVADRVFRQIPRLKLNSMIASASARGCANTAWLAEILDSMNYAQLRSFTRRVQFLPNSKALNVSQVAIERVFLWMLILASRNLVEVSSFRPVLACPYYPGENGTAVAPILFFDGSGLEVSFACEHLRKIAVQESFKFAYQIGAEPRWFAVVVHCIGNVTNAGNEIIEKDADSAAKGYDPIIFVDENTMVSHDTTLELMFQ
jgi:hypothetical protein